jgi:hypothetical protein
MRFLATAQGLYYMVTGVWPVLHIDSFLAVTGAKTDLWLVKTVGLLIAVIGAAIFRGETTAHALSRDRSSWPPGSAGCWAPSTWCIALWGVISKIYLLDAVPEAVLVAGWSIVWRRRATL